MRKKIIITDVGGGIENTLPLVKTKGFDLFIISERDLRIDNFDEQLFISPEKINEVLNYLKQHKDTLNIAGVTSWGLEKGVPLAAAISEEFKFPGINKNQANILTNKYQLYKELSSANFPVPLTKKISNLTELHNVAKATGFPLVIKPADGAGAKGVKKVYSLSELGDAYNHAQKISTEIIVQELLIGTEHSIEGVVHEGKLTVTGFSDRLFRYKEFDPFFVEEGDILPSTLSQNEILAAKQLLINVAKQLKIDNGVLKGDFIFTKQGFKIIELAGRLGSPNFWKLNNLAYGTNSISAMIDICTGQKPSKKDITMENLRGVAFKCLFFKKGFYKKILFHKELQSFNGFHEFKWWKGVEPRTNTFIGDFKNLTDMVAYVVATGKTNKEASRHCDKIIKSIEVITE